MHITVLQENLLKAIQDASRCISNKPQLPILSGILVKADQSEIMLQATDLRVGFHGVIGGKIEKTGECVIPAKLLTDLVSSLQPGSIELRSDETVIHVKQGRVKAKLPIFAAIDFPPFPQISTPSVSLPAAEFFSLIEKTTYAASLDESRPVLASSLLRFDSTTCTAVCTDGYRLVLAIKTIEASIEPQSVLLNAKMLAEIGRILARFKPKTVDFVVSNELQQVRFAAGSTFVLARLTEGEFPPYERIIPRSFLIRTIINREEMLQALRTALVVARESSSIVTLRISSKTLTLLASSSSSGENEIQLDSTYEGTDEKNISFNAKFVMDALSHIETDRFELCMNDELKPAVLFPEGNEEYTTVIMPFKR